MEFKDLLLIFLDSEITGGHGLITGARYDWLKNLLEQKGPHFRSRIAGVRRPLFPVAEHIGGSLDTNPQLRDRLPRPFVKEQVGLVVAGHEHIYDRRKVDGVTYVISGGAGAPLPDDPKGFYNFVFLAETDAGLQGYAFNIGGALKDQVHDQIVQNRQPRLPTAASGKSGFPEFPSVAGAYFPQGASGLLAA